MLCSPSPYRIGHREEVRKNFEKGVDRTLLHAAKSLEITQLGFEKDECNHQEPIGLEVFPDSLPHEDQRFS
jgi:hypothetical protein